MVVGAADAIAKTFSQLIALLLYGGTLRAGPLWKIRNEMGQLFQRFKIGAQ